MRPLFLQIEGVKSITDKQTVDFERVSRNGIFGIFGKTGSGKSTILDGIVLALYGEVISNIGNSDFVNTSCQKAEVQLVFSVQEGGENKKYRVERRYKFDKNRKNLTASANLWQITLEGENAIAEGTKRVNDCIKEEIIGLSKGEFLKCIALPQGEFSSFIKMTRGERLSIIGKLFDLEKYGKQLYGKFRAQDDELQLEESRLLGESENLKVYTAEHLENLKNEMESVKEQEQTLLAKVGEKQRKYNELSKTYSLVCERETKTSLKSEKLAYKPVIEGYKQEIQRFSSVELVASDINLLKECTEGIDKNNKELQKLLQQEQKNNDRLKEINEQKDKLPQKQKKVTDLEIRIEKLGEINTKCEELKQVSNELKQLRDEYLAINNKIKDYESKKQIQVQKAEEFLSVANEYNAKQAISNLASNLSQNAVSEFANERLQFIFKLKKELNLQEEINNESAVNRLIDQEIEILKAKIGTNENFEVANLLKQTLQVIENNSKYLKAYQEALGKVNEFTVSINAEKEKLEGNVANGKKAKALSDKLDGEINAVLGGLTLEQAVKQAKDESEKLQAEIKAVNADNEAIGQLISNNNSQISVCRAIISQLNEQLSGATERVKKGLLGSGVTLEKASEILNSKQEIENHKTLVDAYEKELASLETRIGELNVLLKESFVTKEQVDLEGEILANLTKNQQEITRKCGEITNNYKNSLINNKKWCIIEQAINEISLKRKSIGKMLEMVKDSRFMEFIAEEYLKEIASEAENRVLTLTSGRYGLIYQNGNFYVADNLSGGKHRPCLSLSGGETFLVSLSLALALSSQISQKALRPLDFFFLDEGFGTLDDDLIDAVTESLEKLRKANLTVGLITHVGELKNRIQSRIVVTGATALHGTTITEDC